MGAIKINLEGISFAKGKEHLQDFQCSNCQLFISELDISQENYSFWLSDYANDISKSYVGNNPCYGADFWLKGVDHLDCPSHKDHHE